MNKSEWLVLGVIAAFLMLCLSLTVDRFTADRVSVGTGVVIRKAYSPATNSTGVGFAYDGKNWGPVAVSSSTAEEWVVIVRHGGNTFSLKVEPTTWGYVDEGSKVDVFEMRGKIKKWGKTVQARHPTRD